MISGKNILHMFAAVLLCGMPTLVRAESGSFDMARWEDILNDVRMRAQAQHISTTTIKETLKSPMFIPSIVQNDKNQSEFKLSLNDYLERTVNSTRVANGRKMAKQYPTMLERVEKRFGVPRHVILAFWGMESNYGSVKSTHRLKDAFFTLMYDGRREKFFGEQLLSLMKIADNNSLDINAIYGSWAGAMGHFQFIPTTLAQYGVDGNGDGRIDIIHSIGDAMFSAGNYLNKLGWNQKERIVRRVVIPADLDSALLKGNIKKTISEWTMLGVTNPDGSALPHAPGMVAGLVVDTATIDVAKDAFVEQNPDTDVAARPVITAYLTYPNFYRIKKWNNSNWYAIAIAELSDKLK